MATKEEVAARLLTISDVPKTAALPELNQFLFAFSKGTLTLYAGELCDSDEELSRWVVAVSDPRYIQYFTETVKETKFQHSGSEQMIRFEKTKPEDVPASFLKQQTPVPGSFSGTVFQNYPPQSQQADTSSTGAVGGQGHHDTSMQQPPSYPGFPGNQQQPYFYSPPYDQVYGQYAPYVFYGPGAYQGHHSGQQSQQEPHHKGQDQGHCQGQQQGEGNKSDSENKNPRTVQEKQSPVVTNPKSHEGEEDADYTDAMSARPDIPGREEPGSSSSDMSATTVEVLDLPQTVSERDLKKYFESKKVAGENTVESVKIEEERALVQFKSEEVVKKVVSKKKHSLKKKTIEVKLYTPPEESSSSSSSSSSEEEEEEESEEEEEDSGTGKTIKVSGFSGDMSEETLIMYFENKRRSGGGDVTSVRLNTDHVSAYITFDSAEVAERVVQKESHKLGGKTLEVRFSRGVSRQVSCGSQGDLNSIRLDSSEPVRTVKVTGFDSTISDEMLEIYFENKKKAEGGPVEKVELNEDETEAYITFLSVEDAVRVAEKDDHILNSQPLTTELHFPSKQEDSSDIDEEVARRTIVVTGFESSASEDLLELYFESKKKSGGGLIESCLMSEDSTVFTVTYEEEEVAERVVGREHMFAGQKLTVCQQSVMFEADEEQLDPARTVEVSWSADSASFSEDQLELYFESKKKSGGENVEKIFMSEDGNAIISFETEGETQKVLRKMKHSLSGVQLCVAQYTPSSRHKRKKISKDQQHRPSAAGFKKETETKLGAKKNSKPETDENDEPVRTVRVKGFPKDISTDTLEFYFENTRRSGGGEIEEAKIAPNEDTGETFMYITFKSVGVAEKVVAKGNHIVDGSELTVAMYKPPPPVPIMEDCIFISNLQPSTTQDCLANFLEAKSNASPKQFMYSEKEGGVVVVFEEAPDIDRLKEVCKKKQLENVHLNIENVPHTNCIQVTNFAEHTTPDTLKYYFENERRCGGGDVLKVKRLDSDCFLVYFENYQVVSRVVERSHTVEGLKLEVKPYLECLGRCYDGDSQPQLKLPTRVTVENIDKEKGKFVKGNEKMKNALENQLKSCHANVIWDEDNVCQIVLECTLSDKVPNARKLARDWQRTVEENLDDFLKTIEVHCLPVIAEFWDNVREKISSINVENPKSVAISMEKTHSMMKVIGLSPFVKQLKNEIEKIIEEERKENERRKQRVVETKTDVQPLKLKMLLASKFPTEMENQNLDLKVKINQKSTRNEISFDGFRENVQFALMKMYEHISKFEERKVLDVSKLCLVLYQKKAVKDYIVRKLKTQSINAVWEATNKSLTVCSWRDTIDASVEVIIGCLVERCINLSIDSRKVLSTKQWLNKVEEILQQRQELAIIQPERDLTKITVASTDEINQDILSGIGRFLDHNTVLEEKISLPPGILRYLQLHRLADLKEIEKKLSQFYVSITVCEEDQCVSLRGTREGIEDAKRSVKAMADKIERGEFEDNTPRLAGYTTSGRGSEVITKIERQHLCAIDITGNGGAGYGAKKQVGVGLRIHAVCKAYDDRKVYTVEGDMTELNVDVLVNTADNKLTMTGGLAKAIIAKGGKDIEDECSDFVRNSGYLDEGGVYCSRAGRLPCSMIVHVVGPHWGGGRRGEKEALKQTVFKSMNHAASKNLRSIAIPAISCGLYNYPAREATAVISNAVKDFFREVQESSLFEVYLCDVKPQTVEYFTESLGDAFGKRSIMYLPQQSDTGGRRRNSSSSDSDDEDYATSPVRMARQEMMSLGKISVKICKDEMAKQQVDVIVNTTSKNLELKNGAVSATLLNAGGPDLQQEIKAKYPKGLKRDGEIAETSGANLQCKRVFHSSMGNWSGPESETDLQNFVENCLKLADKRGETTIAFPAIGTGNLNFPRDVVAKQMFRSVASFSEKHPRTSLAEVRFVLYHKDHPTIKAFELEERQWKGGRRTGNRSGRDSDVDSGHTTKKALQVIDDPLGSDYDILDDPESAASDEFVDARAVRMTGKHQAECQFGSILVRVHQGDITRVKADCIVNSSNEDLDLSRGAVASAIAKLGGDKLMDEISKLVPTMKREGLVITNAYNMQCSKIIHIVAQQSSSDWGTLIGKCFELAEKGKIKSIAFPALGTAMNIPPEEIAEAIFTSIHTFERSAPKHLKEISVVVFQQPMVKEFIAALTKKPTSVPQGNYTQGAKSKGKMQGETSKRSTKPEGPSGKGKKVVFVIYAANRSVIEKVKAQLKAMIAEAFIKRRVEDEIICKFSQDQQRAVKALEKRHSVDVFADFEKGVIGFSGLVENVIAAKDAIHPMILEAYKGDQQKSKADLLARLIQWYYIEVTDNGSETKPYDAAINCLLEEAYKNQEDKASFTEKGETFTVDFKTMEETPQSTPSDVAKVIRRVLGEGAASAHLPEEWSKMDETENLQVINLKKGDTEWQEVEKDFIASAGKQWTVSEIKRIQNRFMYQQYAVKKKFLETQNGPNVKNERILWHGTAPEAVDSINSQGFNRSYCGKNATAFGDGVYFAVAASYSCSDTYSRPDTSGVKRIYRCKVLTGQYTVGKGGMRVPPIRSGHETYDSVTNNTSSPSMYIIFNDTQAYPEYLISFK